LEALARRLVEMRERRAAEPNVLRILEILNPEPEPAEEESWRDARTGMNFETLFECGQQLSELMDTWLAAACCLDRWPLQGQLEDDLNRRRIRLAKDRAGRVSYEFSGPYRKMVDLGLGGGYQIDEAPGRTYAVSMFFQFVTGPFQRDVGKCKRGGKYWRNHWNHESKAYCSARCSSADTATRVTRERREKEHRAKLGLVQAAIRQFDRLPAYKRSRLNWKKWVKAEAGPEVTISFITRAVNKRELKAPRGVLA